MGQLAACTSVRRYNVRMAADSKHQGPKILRARANLANNGFALTPEELAEFIDSIEYDEAPAAVADCANYDPEYND